MPEQVELYKGFAAQLLRDPDDTDALINQFALLGENTSRTNSRNYYALAHRAYQLAPHKYNAVFNYASACHRTGHFEKAYSLYIDALEIAPKDAVAETLHHVGIALRAQGRVAGAIGWYKRAIEASPDDDYIRLRAEKDLALALMSMGKLTEGFKAYEVRKPFAKVRLAKKGGKLQAMQKLPPGVVHWDGEDLTGKTIVVYHEEGSGDFIQFCRCIPQFVERFRPGRILLAGPAADLLDLITDNIAVDGVVPLEGPFGADYVIGSMSLPWRIGLEYANVSGAPYFKTEPADFPLRGMLNVGLAWRGNPDYAMDAHRSMTFEDFTPLFDVPGIAWYSLQMAGSQEITHHGFDGFVADLAPMAKNWRATARLIRRLDCVVSVDTAVAHLAGALGVPAFILVTNACDWRWDRTSMQTAWYDSATVIRQEFQDDWKPCIDAVHTHLTEMVDAARRIQAPDRAGARQAG